MWGEATTITGATLAVMIGTITGTTATGTASVVAVSTTTGAGAIKSKPPCRPRHRLMRAEPEDGRNEPEGIPGLAYRKVVPDAPLDAAQAHGQELAGLASD